MQAQLPSLGAISGPAYVCASYPSGASTTTLYNVSSVNSPTSFTWTSFPTTLITINNPNSPSPGVTFSQPFSNASYTLYCTSSNSFGVSNTVSLVVYVLSSINVTFSGAQSLCQGSSINLSASPTIISASSTILSASSTLYYNWSPSTGLNSTTSASVIANPPATTNYTLLVSLDACTSPAYVTVTVNPLPTISLTSNRPIMCKGESVALNIGGNALSYSVGGVPTTPVFTVAPMTTTNYTVVGSSAYGCKSSAVLTQTVNTCTEIRTNILDEENSLIVYPNPNNGTFRIRSNISGLGYIHNELGQLVRALNLSSGSETEIKELPIGIYFLITERKKEKIIVTN